MNPLRIAILECFVGMMLLVAGLSHAQSNGPLSPAAPAIPRPPAATTKPEPPPVPAEQIIQRFAANEDLLASAGSQYSFEKSVSLQEMGPDNKPAGTVEIVTQEVPGPDGKRYQKVVSRTPSTLRFLQTERGDLNFVDAAPLFPLTTAQLPKYDIHYEGTQPLDELSVYIFGVTPRSLDRAHAYFSGAIWVDQQDFVIVKMIGKWVSENGDVTSAGLPFTVFETYREQVGKKEWFPTYSRSDATLNQGDTRLPIRMIIKWSKYTKGALPAAPPPATAPATTPASDAQPSAPKPQAQP